MPRAPRDYQERFVTRGAGYDDAMVHLPNARDEEFAFALGLLEPVRGEHIADIPSGGGYLADHLPPGVRHLAVDSADAFARRCHDRGATTVMADLRGSCFRTGSIDAVCSIAGIHHEPDLDGLLTSWFSLVRPGGRIVVCDVIAGSAVATFLDGFVGAHNGIGHDGFFLGDDLVERAGAAGFTGARVTDGSYHWWAPDADALGAYAMELFGLSGVTRAEVVAAAAAGPGVDTDAGRVGLRWGLRGLVAVRPGAA